MKNQIILLSVIFLTGLYGCEEQTGPSQDTEQNIFFSRYRDIYKAYGTIPLDSTRRQLQEYLSEYPENADAWAFLGSLNYLFEDYQNAKTDYQRAIQINKKNAAYYTALGTTYSALEMSDSAEFFLLKALSMQDTTAENYFHLSLLFSKKGDYEKSKSYADSTRRSKYITAVQLAGLSLVYSKAGDTTSSEELFISALQAGLKDSAGLRAVLRGEEKLETFYRRNRY